METSLGGNYSDYRQSFYRRWIAAILIQTVYIPVSAHGSDECLKIFQIVLPDLILLDVIMEPMDGWETLEKIRENPGDKGIPVLMFSAKKITLGEASGAQHKYRLYRLKNR